MPSSNQNTNLETTTNGNSQTTLDINTERGDIQKTTETTANSNSPKKIEEYEDKLTDIERRINGVQAKLKSFFIGIIVGGGLIVAAFSYFIDTQVKLQTFQKTISEEVTKAEDKIKELDDLKKELTELQQKSQEQNQQIGKLTERVTIIEGDNPKINFAQIFATHSSSETGKGKIVNIPKNGGRIFSQEITKCQDCRSASYQFFAARYAQGDVDTAIVTIYVYTNQGRYEATHDLTKLVTEYSDMNSDNMQSLKGTIAFQGTPTKVELYVIPGDWGVEIRDFQLQFK